ncbi:MAG: hypothetical protein IKM61_04020 [Eubacteriaceae bacterium]|nr:hypothetical protein [Eubacteriaceae bacterium]
MKKKKMNRNVTDRTAYGLGGIMIVAFAYVMAATFLSDGYYPDGPGIFNGALVSLFTVLGVYFIYNYVYKSRGRYILSPDEISATGKGGKIINEIYVSEIVQAGIVGEELKVAGEQSEYFDMPRYIYLSKRVLTEDERKDILRAASDGSVLLFRYSDKLKYALNEICGIHVAG